MDSTSAGIAKFVTFGLLALALVPSACDSLRQRHRRSSSSRDPLEPVLAAPVLGNKLGPHFHIEPPELFVFSNDTGGVIDCGAHGIPAPSITWRTDKGTVLTAKESTAVSQTDELRRVLAHNHSLHFRPFHARDFQPDVHDAAYRCSAQSQSGTIVSRWVHVRAVLQPDLNVHIRSHPRGHSYAAGSPVLLDCHISKMAREFVVVKEWIKDGHKITPGKTGITQHRDYLMLADTGSLIIFQPDTLPPSHSFRCVAFNEITREDVLSPGFTLNLEGSPLLSPPSWLIPYSANLPHTTFIETDLSSDILIPCFAAGNPPPITSWFKKSREHLLEPLAQSPRLEHLPGGGLRIRAVQRRDLGSYRCVARNSEGETSRTFELVTRPPTFVTSLEPEVQVANLGSEARFECKVKLDRGNNPGGNHERGGEGKEKQENHERGIRPKFHWVKDGFPLSEKEEGIRMSRMEFKDSIVSQLIVMSVDQKDCGVYQCFVEFDKAAAQFSIIVDKNGEPETGHVTQASAELRLGDAAPSLHYTFIDQTVQPGLLISLKCSASGTPTPSIRWLLDGFSLPQNDRYLIGQYVTIHGDVISHLNISQIAAKDGGFYTCQAENRAGKISHSAHLNVYGSPYVRPFPSPLKAVDGKPFMVQCPVAGFPIEEIVWLKANSRIVSSPQIKVYRNGTLMIPEVRKSRDEGSYSCRATNRDGDADQQYTKLKVIVPPQLLPFPVPASLQAGDRLSLTCSVFKGNSPLDITWLRNNITLMTSSSADDDANVIRVDEFTSLLTIPALGLKHNGVYACRAENEAGTAQFGRTVAVNVPPEIIPFPSANTSLPAGVRTRFLCGLLRGDPPVNFRWLWGPNPEQQHPVEPDDNIVIKAVDEFSSLIKFTSLRSEHTGNYTCVAENEAGLAEYTARLSVRVPPRWTMKPTDQERIVGERVEFSCQAEGSPEPKVTWKKEMDSKQGEFRDLYPSSAFNVADAGDWFWSSNGSLILMKSNPEHGGRYLCKVSNGIGQDLMQIVNFTVKAPPKISGESGSFVTTAVGAKVTRLECEATGDTPISVEWTKNGMNLLLNNPRGRYSMETLGTNSGIKSVLSIAGVEKMDEDKYTCRMENPFGSDLRTIHLVVQEPPAPPKDLQVYQVQSNTVRLRWSSPISSMNAMPITRFQVEVAPRHVPWGLLANSEQVPSRSQVLAVSGHLNNVLIEDLRPYVEYKARISAENELGRGGHSEAVLFRTRGAAPDGKPRSVRIASLSPDSLSIHWEDPDSETWNGPLVGYKIGWRELGTDEGSKPRGSSISLNWTEVERHDTSDLVCRLRGLSSYSRFEVLVQAVNEFGLGPVEIVTARTESDVPLKPPGQVRCNAVSEGALDVSWDTMDEDELRGALMHYNVYYQLANGRESQKGEVHGKSSSGSNNVLLEGLAGSANYSILVSAQTRPGEGPVQSNPVFCATKDSVPLAPSALKIFPKSDTSVILAWTHDDSSRLLKTSFFTVYQRFRPSASSTRVETYPTNVPGTARSTEINGLRHGIYYQFWVTASNNVGEGDASPIEGLRMTKDIDLNQIMLISLNQTLIVSRKSSASLECQIANDKYVKRTWYKDGRQIAARSDRVFASGDRLQITSTDTSDSANYTCLVSNGITTEAVSYRLLVQDLPPAPAVTILKKESKSLKIKVDSNASKRDPLPILTCSVFHKQLYGGLNRKDLPGVKILTTKSQDIWIHGLKCGSNYQIYARCSNILGSGSISQQLSARTKGEKPVVPNGSEFIRPSNSTVRLELYKWDTKECPVTYFVVEYRRRQDEHWTMVSNNLELTSRRFTIRQLSPDTMYELKVRANNAAGSAERIYDFRTSASAEQLGSGSGLDAGGSPEEESSGVKMLVIVPIILGCILLAALSLLIVYMLKKKSEAMKGEYLQSEENLASGGDSLNSKSSKYFDTLPPPTDFPHEHQMFQGKSLVPIPEAIYSAPGPPGHTLPSEKLADTLGKIPQRASDIHPYATFMLADTTGKSDSAPFRGQHHYPDGTVPHRDMLAMHQNTTMLVSDANSKSSTSNPYTSVHRPRRRRRKRHSQQSRPPVPLKPLNNPTDASIEESDSDYPPRKTSGSRPSTAKMDLSHWDPSPKKHRQPNEMVITTNKLPPPQAYHHNTAKSLDFDQESSTYSSDGDEDDLHDYQAESDEEERIFVKQENGQFVALKASQIVFHHQTPEQEQQSRSRYSQQQQQQQ